MKVNKLRLVEFWLLIVFLLFIVSGCSSADSLSEKEENDVDKQMQLTVSVDDASYSETERNLENDGKNIGIDKEATTSENNSSDVVPVSSNEVETIEDTFVEETPIQQTTDKQTSIKDTTLEDEVKEIEEMDSDELTSQQRNAINMLNYMTVLTQEINDSKQSRIFLDTAYNSLINNTYPNAVDSRTQTQITSMLDTLHQYQMINVKRERLEYIYEQNQAQILRKKVPDPMDLLNVVQSKNILKATASVLYMAIDSVTSYQTACSQTDLQYLESGWELDDSEAEEIHKSRTGAFNYMLRMVNDNDLPGDYVLTEDKVEAFVTWKNKSNLVSKISWFESNQETYKEFGPYWLELAKDYYDSGEYKSCLNAFEEYEKVATRIFRQDTDYAAALPMAIISAKETMTRSKYCDYADKYTQIILKNSDDWAVRYFVAQTYLDLYKNTKEKTYLDKAYKIIYDNINVLVDEQKKLNEIYLADVQTIKIEKDLTKQQKEDVKLYNKMLKETRKVELPPVNEALYLNCDFLFALIEERGISDKERKQIDAILHENGECIFLSSVLDERFRFDNNEDYFDVSNIDIKFDGEEISIPVYCITDRSNVKVIVSESNGEKIIDDWVVKKVERPKDGAFSEFVVTYKSKTAQKYKYLAGSDISIEIVPVIEAPDEKICFDYEVVSVKKMLVFKGIEFKRK